MRNGAEGRELATARWGMPSSSKALMDATKKRAEKLQAKGKTVDFKELLRMEPDGGTTNIRNVKSKHWTRWLGAENRCVVQFTSFSEFSQRSPPPRADTTPSFDRGRTIMKIAVLPAQSPRAQVLQAPAPGQHQRVVARLSEKEMKNNRLKELLPQFEGVINSALPLVVPPPLEEVRNALLFEFPYAQNVIDTVLADLIGRATVLVRPILIGGEPGAGRSLLGRRIAECLRVFCWRTDASRSDAVFSGTDRRRNSAEPCHPFLAIARARHANPMVLLDELDKPSTGTRADTGRLWDCLLNFLESETSIRYPDPFFQTNVDLSQISYLATANSVAGLPRPLLDRMRVINLPLPSRDHLDALLPAVIADLARERGLDASWFATLDGEEHAPIASAWNGGSVRNLRRLVEVILRDRDANANANATRN